MTFVQSKATKRIVRKILIEDCVLLKNAQQCGNTEGGNEIEITPERLLLKLFSAPNADEL